MLTDLWSDQTHPWHSDESVCQHWDNRRTDELKTAACDSFSPLRLCGLLQSKHWGQMSRRRRVFIWVGLWSWAPHPFYTQSVNKHEKKKQTQTQTHRKCLSYTDEPGDLPSEKVGCLCVSSQRGGSAFKSLFSDLQALKDLNSCDVKRQKWGGGAMGGLRLLHTPLRSPLRPPPITCQSEHSKSQGGRCEAGLKVAVIEPTACCRAGPSTNVGRKKQAKALNATTNTNTIKATTGDGGVCPSTHTLKSVMCVWCPSKFPFDKSLRFDDTFIKTPSQTKDH